MIEFIRNNFRKWYTVVLWLILIGFIVAGLIIGWFIGSSFGGYASNKGMYQFFGVLIGGTLGTLVGLIFIIIGGGLVATFLNIDENIQKLVNSQVNLFIKDDEKILKNEFVVSKSLNIKKLPEEKIWQKKFIVSESIDMKNSPDNEGENIFSLKNGTIVLFLDQVYEETKTRIIWYKINYKNMEGWCIANKLEKYYD